MVDMRPGERIVLEWTIALDPPAPAAQLEISIDCGTTWHPTTRAGDTISALFAGPDAQTQPGGSTNPAGTILVTGAHPVSLRLIAAPTIDIAPAGHIYLTRC